MKQALGGQIKTILPVPVRVLEQVHGGVYVVPIAQKPTL
jgi:hypothetical protein